MSSNANPFAAPAQAGGYDLEEGLGHLVVITPLEYLEAVETVHGPSPAIRANVLDVDDDEMSSEDALLFPKVLVGSLRSRIGQKVLGVIGQGEAKPGKNAPWVLVDASTDSAQVKRAQAALLATQKVAAPAKADKGSTKPPF